MEKHSRNVPAKNIKLKRRKKSSKVPSELQLLDIYLYFNEMSENKQVIEKEDFVKLFGKFHINKDQAEQMFDELVANKKIKVIKFEEFLTISYGSFNENQKFLIRKKLKKIKNNLLYLCY
jgi:hypothetical protein